MSAEQDKKYFEEIWNGPLLYPLHIVHWVWPRETLRGRKVEVKKRKPEWAKKRRAKNHVNV